ncbi:hypothetical protein FCR2A7T_13500 [Flavobacterium cauense R2A-7]|uniref:Tetratricopeptide repeat protein n=1 Tax=Flavobacterium cauense R2A-7 TaxID=1341154 RepID=V6RZT1_9FLAO|nr:hypothetical protein [Flavobacterium cauense]ESU19943.1 hypothetical protein FCR2A7T_13500 [Flavobacterium cauense R2A-7]TWI12366.1 hypothetical protein IP98_01578 [Flavobacterium cauense R2A-7]
MKKSIYLLLLLLYAFNMYSQQKDENHTKGLRFLIEGNYKEAISQFTLSIAKNPKDSESYELRGNAYMGINDISKAMTDLAKAIQINKNNINAYKTRGILKMNLQDYRGAILDFDVVVKDHQKTLKSDVFGDVLKDLNAEAYAYRALCKLKLDDSQGAMQDAEEAIKYKPYEGIAYYVRGFYRLNSGNKNEGCMDLSKAGELGYQEAYQLIQKYCN